MQLKHFTVWQLGDKISELMELKSEFWRQFLHFARGSLNVLTFFGHESKSLFLEYWTLSLAVFSSLFSFSQVLVTIGSHIVVEVKMAFVLIWWKKLSYTIIAFCFFFVDRENLFPFLHYTVFNTCNLTNKDGKEIIKT